MSIPPDINPEAPELYRAEETQTPPQNFLKVTVGGQDLVIEITKVTIHGKKKQLGQLNKAELKAITELFQKALAEEQKSDRPASPLTKLRVTVSPSKTQEDLKVTLATTHIEGAEERTHTADLKQAAEVSAIALNALEDSVNLINKDDDYPDKDLRYSTNLAENKAAREAARDPRPFIGKVGELGTEKLDKYQTIAMANRTSKAALKYLNSRLLELKEKADKEGIERCRELIEYHEKVLAQIERHRSIDDKGWLDCNYWRYLIRDHQDYHKAAEQYIGGAVNMRMHTYKPNKADGRSVQFLRTGVMADMRNTWYSIAFLQKVQEAEEKEASQLIGSKAQEIIKRLEKAKALPMEKGDEALMLFEEGNVKEGLDKILSYIETRLADSGDPPEFTEKCRLQSAQRALGELQQITKDKEVAAQVIRGRQCILDSQMLQMVQAQVAAHPNQLSSLHQNPFRMAYVTFVNCHSAKLDKTGWMHDENVELQDMNKALKDRTLIFGKMDSASFTDEEGNFHLPAPTPDMVGKTRKLNTLFIAVTPQNNTTNDGTQLEINKAAKEKLEKLRDEQPLDSPLRAKLQKVIDKLNFEKGDYTIAEEIVAALLETEAYAVAIGCASAKDRTGLVAERVVARVANEQNPQDSGTPPVTVDELLEVGGAAVRVVYENTGEDAFKADPDGIPGGVSARLKGAKRFAGVWLRGDKVVEKWQRSRSPPRPVPFSERARRKITDFTTSRAIKAARKARKKQKLQIEQPKGKSAAERAEMDEKTAVE